MRRKLLRSTLSMAMIVLLCSMLLIFSSLYGYYNDMRIHQLRDQLSIAAIATEQGGISFLSSVGSSYYRLTWLSHDGTVIYDTLKAPEQLSTHADREEFQEAIATGRGSAVRTSLTATERTVYEAVSLSDGTVLRISVRWASPLGLVPKVLPAVLAVIIVIFLLSLLMSRRISQRIIGPINAIDPIDPPASAT